MPAESKGQSLAGACVVGHLSCLRACGFCRLPPHTPRPKRVAHELYRMFALAATGFYLLQQYIYAYQEHNDMEKLSRVMFLMLCHTTSFVKQVVFHMDADRIDMLVAWLDDAALQGSSSVARALLPLRTAAARRLHRAYAGMGALTCVLWMVLTVALYVRTRVVDFPFWLPATANEPHQFALVMVFSYYATTLVAIANTTMDAFIGALLDQYTAQLQILRMDLQALSLRAETTDEEVLLQMFYGCLDHYSKICTAAQLVENIFGNAIFVQFAVAGWILCMSAYKVVSISVLSVEFASMLLFIMCILTELFLYCYFGNQLTDESERVQEALFACGWERWPQGAGRVRRALMLARERAHRPLRTIAAGVVLLSLDTFLKIMKSSYSFYAVLRQTK